MAVFQILLKKSVKIQKYLVSLQSKGIEMEIICLSISDFLRG